MCSFIVALQEHKENRYVIITFYSARDSIYLTKLAIRITFFKVKTKAYIEITKEIGF